MRPEDYAAGIKKVHDLSGFHIFDQEDGKWRVFGYRKHAKGYQASVEKGAGKSIMDALTNLDRRLIEGPIHPNAQSGQNQTAKPSE